jgi:hypothetical protein
MVEMDEENDEDFLGDMEERERKIKGDDKIFNKNKDI